MLQMISKRRSQRLDSQAGGVPQLISLLSAGPDSEITEYAAAALGNLGAGGACAERCYASGGPFCFCRLS